MFPDAELVYTRVKKHSEHPLPCACITALSSRRAVLVLWAAVVQLGPCSSYSLFFGEFSSASAINLPLASLVLLSPLASKCRGCPWGGCENQWATLRAGLQLSSGRGCSFRDGDHSAECWAGEGKPPSRLQKAALFYLHQPVGLPSLVGSPSSSDRWAASAVFRFSWVSDELPFLSLSPLLVFPSAVDQEKSFLVVCSPMFEGINSLSLL